MSENIDEEEIKEHFPELYDTIEKQKLAESESKIRKTFQPQLMMAFIELEAMKLDDKADPVNSGFLIPDYKNAPTIESDDDDFDICGIAFQWGREWYKFSSFRKNYVQQVHETL